MKSLFQRFNAVFLILLLLCAAAVPVSALRSPLSPICELGTDPSDMLYGGGRRVDAGDCLYYIDDSDGAVYELSDVHNPVLDGPVAKLNYADGSLYFARIKPDSFDLCIFDLESAKESVLLEDFSGRIGQLYLVNRKCLVFSAGESVWNFDLESRSCSLLVKTSGLLNFIPTASGLIYATGELFDCNLYANGKPLAQHVETYTVRFDLEDGLLVYSCGGADCQMDLTSAFLGHAKAQSFVGYVKDHSEQAREEAQIWDCWSPEETALRYAGAIYDSREETEDAPPLFYGHAVRQPANDGTLNIVRRARQMLNVQWTPVGDKGFGGWGYTDLSYGLEIFYEPGVTYTGLPYGQCVGGSYNGSYVPWSVSLSGFVAAVNDVESKLYTDRCTYWRGSQCYGTDCSGFVSWAWQTPNRKTCPTLIDWEHTVKVGHSYSVIQLGDALISEGHAVLVTDVTYSLDGTITSIEISQANPTAQDLYNGCAYSTRYSGSAALEILNKNYFVNGSYSVYRNSARGNVTYTHDCAVPLDGDVCPLCGCGSEPAPEDPTPCVGIDLSEWNTITDWSAVAEQVDFVILRIGWTGTSEGLVHKDSAADTIIQNCVQHDIPFGLYYYAGATTTDQAREEADAILGWLMESGITPSLPIFYDVEEPRNILTLSNGELAEVISAFCSELEDVGLRAGVYASASVWDDRFRGYDFYQNTVHWVAHWGTEHVTAKLGANVWQYSSSGTVAGIKGDVDMNYWIGPLGETEHPSTLVLTPPACVDGSLCSTCTVCGRVLEQPIPGGVGHIWSFSEVLTQGETLHDSTGLYRCINCDTATKEAPLCAAEVFSDLVDAGEWAHAPIDWAYFNGLTSGTSATTFSPNDTVTRGQVVTFLYTFEGRPEVTDANPFADVNPSDYYYQPVLWAVENTITSGTSETTFSPANPCVRAQIVTFLWAAAGRPEPEGTECQFVDVSADDYFYKAVLWAAEKGVTGGIDSYHFGPNENCTRAQMVTFLKAAAPVLEEARYAGVVQKPSQDTAPAGPVFSAADGIMH